MKPNNKPKVAHIFRRNYFAEKIKFSYPYITDSKFSRNVKLTVIYVTNQQHILGGERMKLKVEWKIDLINQKSVMSPTQIYVTVRLSKLISSQIPKAEEC